MNYALQLISRAQLARWYGQSLPEMLGRALTWLDWDILQRWMLYSREGKSDGS